MKTFKRRACSALLALCMALPLFPANVWAAGNIPVTSKSLDVPLFNKQTYLNNAFKEETLYGVQNTRQMNAGKGFQLFETKACKTAPAQNFYDNFDIALEHASDHGWWVAHYEWDTATAPVFRELMRQGELSTEVSAIMRYSEHFYLFRHGTAKDHTYIAIRHASQADENGYIKFVMTPEDNDEVMKRYGNNSWAALPYLENDSKLRLRLNHTNCMCGASMLVNGTVAFADTAGPGVPQVSVTTNGGNGRYFNSGTIDITLTFDEYIRLANPNAALSQSDAQRYGLNLLAYDRRTNTSRTLVAPLVEMGEKTMRFQYTIPADEAVDVVVSGISGDQPFFDDAEMYLYTANGKYESFPGFNLRTSLVCDLAGNRINDKWNTNIVFPESQQIYIDNIAPEYASTALQGNMISSGQTPGDPEEGTWPEGADRSQVFAGVGDWLQMQIYFNEELSLQNAADVEVVLNIRDAGGNPITVNGSTVTSIKTGVDARIPVTMLTTERFTIEEGWQPTEPGRAIRAVEIRMTSSATDLCGNEFSNRTISVDDIPAQQEYLDVTPPAFTPIIAADNQGVYTLPTNQDGVSYFAVRVTDIADDRITENSQAHVSGSNAVGDNADSTESGSFTLDGTNVSGTNVQFEYYVTALPNPAISESSWKTGYAGTAIRFTQVQDGTYIFIRPVPGQEYIQLHDPVLTVRGFDHAGNKAEMTYRLSQPDLFRDTTPPTVGANVLMAAEDGNFGFGAYIEASDAGRLSRIAYKLDYVMSADGTDPGYTAPTEPGSETDGWTYIDPLSESAYSFNADPVWVNDRNLYYAYLTFYAQDTDGNEFIQTIRGSADWRSGAFSIDVPTGLSEEPISISGLDKTVAQEIGAKTRNIAYSDDTEANLDTSWTEQTYGSLYVYVEPQRELTVDDTLRPMLLVIDDLVDDGAGSPVSREGVMSNTESGRVDDLFGSLATINISPWVSTLEGTTLPEENHVYFQGMLANFSSIWDQWTENNQIVIKDDAGSITGFSIGNKSEYSYTPISNFHASYPAWAQNLAGAYQNYYGDLKLYTINAPLVHFNATRGNIDGTDEKAFTYSAQPDQYYPWDIQEYIIKRAYVAEGDSNPVHGVTPGTPFLSDGTELVQGTDGKYYKADQTTLHTLSGVRIPFDISNARAADWGMEDLDFENSYMQLYVDGTAYGEQVPLAANSTGQVFSFPDDLIYDCTSTYDVKVTLTAKTSGHIDEYSIMQPIMFCTAAGSSTLLSLSLYQSPGYFEVASSSDGEIKSIVLHEEMLDSEPGTYLVNTDFETKVNMTGNTEVCPENWNGGHRSYGDAYIWNAAVPDKKWKIEGAASYSWSFSLVQSAEEIYDLDTSVPNNAVIPIIKGQPNTICIQGGSDYNYNIGDTYSVYEPGEVIQLPVTLISGQLPEVRFQAEPSDRTSQSAELAADIDSLYGVKELWYQKGQIEEDEYGDKNYRNMVQVTLDDENHLCMQETGEKITITENGNYTLLAIDSYGGVTVAETTVSNIDNTAPVLAVSEKSAADGSYRLDLTATEENAGAASENLTLYLSSENPDEAKEEETPVTDPAEPEREKFTIIPWSEAPDMKYGGSASTAGIYAMVAEYSGGETGHMLHAVIEGAVPESGTLWAWTTDEAGNRSQPVQLFSNQTFAAPAFESVEKDPDGGVILHFTGGVLLAQPTDGAPDSAYGKVKENVPIYQDGTHTITYYDFFGNVYTEQITVAVDGDFSLANVSFSETAPTRNDVTVTVTSTDENHLLNLGGCTVTDLAGTPMDTGLYTVTPAADGESIQILMKENGVITLDMTYGEQTSSKVIRVDNIDREVNARLIWSYADGMEHEPGDEVDGAVTVRAVSTDSSETLIGTNGALSYSFAEGSTAGSSYTFAYRDPAGNAGTITATLPVNIRSNVPEPLGFDMEIFLTQRGVLLPAGNYSYSGGDAAYSFDGMPMSMENRLNLQANRADAEVLILPEGTQAADIDENTQSTAISGITLSGKSLIISENVSFTLAVRSGGEVIVLPVQVTNISRLDEVGLIYATLDRYSRRVYFDPNGQTLTLTNQSGIAQETEHTQYQGYYYHDFTANGSFTFYYEDAAGNTGSITASVWDLVSGNVEPENPAQPIRWWPYKLQDAEGVNQSTLTDSMVNYDVTAQIKYNMNIAEAALYYNDGSGGAGSPVPLETASLNVSLDTVNVTYHQNADAVLQVTGENGTKHTLTMGEVSVIDKIPPEVAHDYVSGDMRQSAEITFTPTEEVLCDENPSAQYYSPGNPMKVTVTENGIYSYTFRDKAGNRTALTVNVTDIDTTAPQLRFKLSSSGKEYDSWEALRAENDVTNVTSIHLCADEPAVCRFQEQNIPLNQGEWMMLPINLNGVYGMTVTDSAGNAVLISLSGLLIPDETAPTLWITPSRISVYTGISDEALSSALMAGVSASDNDTPADEIKITVNHSVLDVMKKGVYEVSYTAQDKAGNIGTGTRSVTVIGEDDLTLTVNGVLTTPMGTMVLDTGSVDFTVGNLPETNGIFEPYLLYVKKGFLTMGQMKNNANKVQDNHAELYGSGYYTVYVVAQNRRQYLTYLYIEQ